MKCSHLGNSAIVTNPPLKQKQRTNCLLSDGDIADYNDDDDDNDEDDDDDDDTHDDDDDGQNNKDVKNLHNTPGTASHQWGM